MLVAGCARRLRPPGQRAASPGGSPLLDKAIAAKEKHAQAWRDAPGIAGSGVGLNRRGKPVIEVFKDKTGRCRSPRDARRRSCPDGRSRGSSLARSLPTDPLPETGPDRSLVRPRRRRDGHARSARYGRDRTVYALSNNHVFAGVNTASIGDPIIQPGDVDGGSDPDDRIGDARRLPEDRLQRRTRTRWTPQSRSRRPANVGTATPPDGYGAPSPDDRTCVRRAGRCRSTDAQRGFNTGRRSTRSTSTSTSATSPQQTICFPGFEARFVNQFADPRRDAFSASGDSGSLLVDPGRQPAGRVALRRWRRPDDREPDRPRAERFGVTIDGAPPTEGPPSAPTGLVRSAGDGQRDPVLDGVRPSTAARRSRTTRCIAGQAGTQRRSSRTPAPRRRFVDSGLTNGTTYYYKVSAENVYGESALSNEVSATPADLVPADSRCRRSTTSTA